MKKIRIGVFGATRGSAAVNFCVGTGKAEVVAICDRQEAVLARQKEYLNGQLGLDTITYYTEFEEFLRHDMDAVIVANFATEHAPYAIRCLERGLHVYSEVAPFQTLQQAVRLMEAVEASGKVYALAENYAYMPMNYEMRRLYREGKIGEFEYGEGEYVHNCMPIWASLTYGDPMHWRNTMYANFYCTHSIGPIVHITGLRPVSVVGIESKMTERKLNGGAKGGLFGMELITFENGGIMKSLHGDLYKGQTFFCVYGSKGRMETTREDVMHHANETGGENRLFVNYDYVDRQGELITENETYIVPMNEEMLKSGHWGGDYVILSQFLNKIQGDETADIIDVYEAADIFLPGLFAYRSVLAGGIPMTIPNLRDKEIREQFRNDTACVDPKVAGDMLIPSFSQGNPEIPEEVYRQQREIWQRQMAEKSGYVQAAIVQGRLK